MGSGRAWDAGAFDEGAWRTPTETNGKTWRNFNGRLPSALALVKHGRKRIPGDGPELRQAQAPNERFLANLDETQQLAVLGAIFTARGLAPTSIAAD